MAWLKSNRLSQLGDPAAAPGGGPPARPPLWQCQRAATAVEYGLILALIFMACVTAISAFSDRAIAMWMMISNTIGAAL